MSFFVSDSTLRASTSPVKEINPTARASLFLQAAHNLRILEVKGLGRILLDSDFLLLCPMHTVDTLLVQAPNSALAAV